MTGDLLTLSVLKFAGLAVVLASTVWGMTRKITAEDESGRKRLTPAGHFAIALAVGSFVIAASSHGFEMLTKQAQARDAALADAAAAARETTREARELRSWAALQKTSATTELIRWERLARDAEDRAESAEQRLLILRNASADRQRDLALSSGVNRSSRANLSRTSAVLGQVERLLQPIGTIHVTVTWQIPLQDQMPALREEHADAAGVGYLEPDSPLFPTFESAPAVAHAIASPSIFGLFANPVDAESAALRFVGNGVGDLSFFVINESPLPIEYLIREHALEFSVQQSVEPRRSGNIVSAKELETATLAVQLVAIFPPVTPSMHHAAAVRARARPTLIRIVAGGREFRLGAENLRRVERPGSPMYIGRFTRQR